MKQQVLHHWMLHSAPAHTQDLIPNQRQQAWTRLILISFGALYIGIHGSLFAEYKTLCISSVSIYILWQIYTFIDIPRHPLSTSRFIISPILDAFLIAIGIMLDGGQNSGVFLCYFVMIMSNGVRFGNPLLFYSQALATISYLCASAFTYLHPQLTLDIPLLLLHLISLLLLPYYIYIISKHAKASLKAKEQAQRLSFGVLDRSPIPIFTFQGNHDEAPRITYSNAAMQQVYRDDITNLVGEQVDMIALMEDGNEVIKACQESLKKINSEPHRFYVRGRNSENQLLQIMGQTSTLHLLGKTIGICFLTDITQNETVHSDMEKSMHEGHVSTLVAGIAHDFRNILTSIIGSAEVMQFSVQDKSIHEQLGLIIDAGERGSDIVSNLLSQNVSNENTRSATSQDIHRSLTSMVNLLRIQLPAHIQLILNMEENLPQINTSLTQLEQILMNLIKNSSEAMQRPGRISIQLRSDPRHKLATDLLPALNISVCDEGQGISPENIELVTKPFWTSRSEKGGTGLGLAMVERIVRNSGGVLDIQSTVGLGTQINITFPAAHNEPHTNIVAQDNITDTEDNTNNNKEETPKMSLWHILLVDDEPSVLSIHQHLLERMGHTVTTAESGEEAFEIYQASLNDRGTSFDLVASDFRMEGMDGIDLSKLIRQHDAHLPIMIITGFGNIDKLQESQSINVNILHKPTSYKKLEAFIIKLQQSA